MCRALTAVLGFLEELGVVAYNEGKNSCWFREAWRRAFCRQPLPRDLECGKLGRKARNLVSFQEYRCCGRHGGALRVKG